MKTGMDLSAADGELTDVDLGEQTKNSVSYGSWTLASRVTGLVRVAVVAGVLGPTFLGNTYQIAVSVPTLTFELTGALFASLLIPALVLSIDRNDRRHSERIAGGFLGVTMMGLAALTVVGVLASPLLFKLFSFSIDSSSVASEQQRVGVILLATLMPLVVLYGIVGTAGAVLNAHGRFALPAGAPIVENLGVIATMGVYVVYAGIGQSLASVGTGALLILGIGTTAAAALHAAV
ncbi:MAG: lipid II flippase MurJ, partial [Gaiellales bacterium]